MDGGREDKVEDMAPASPFLLPFLSSLLSLRNNVVAMQMPKSVPPSPFLLLPHISWPQRSLLLSFCLSFFLSFFRFSAFHSSTPSLVATLASSLLIHGQVPPYHSLEGRKVKEIKRGSQARSEWVSFDAASLVPAFWCSSSPLSPLLPLFSHYYYFSLTR